MGISFRSVGMVVPHSDRIVNEGLKSIERARTLGLAAKALAQDTFDRSDFPTLDAKLVSEENLSPAVLLKAMYIEMGKAGKDLSDWRLVFARDAAAAARHGGGALPATVAAGEELKQMPDRIGTIPGATPKGYAEMANVAFDRLDQAQQFFESAKRTALGPKISPNLPF